MISFKEYFLIKEEKDIDELLYSWMNPVGKIFTIHETEGAVIHNDAAKILADRFNLRKIRPLDPSWDTNMYDTMYNAGWMRIKGVLDGPVPTIYCNNNMMYPNPRQLLVLRDLAIENDIQEIVFDSNRSKKLLWERE